MQTEIKTPSLLINQKGSLEQVGWAKDLLMDYDRKQIKASNFRIKEWDYYAVLSETMGISFTISDLGYIGFVAATVFDFSKATEISNAITTPLPLGSFNMPNSSKQGDVVFRHKNLDLKFIRNDDKRGLEFSWKNFSEGRDLQGSIELQQPDQDETTVIATPFAANPRAFYYNQKVNCMPASGEFSLGDATFAFSPRSDFGVLDWGRGVWTYANTWYWGSASGLHGDKRFGFNIGYGFGDTSAASENTLFVDGKIHKLEEISFHIPEDSFLKPWNFTSSDDRFEMEFNPILDRFSNTNLLLVQSWQHQVFGRFSGQVVLDDGTKIILKDFLGFAEKVKNRW